MPAKQTFFDRHLGTVVTVGLLAATQIASFAVLRSDVSALQERGKDVVTRAEHSDLLRRTEKLEQELVPRSEHLLRDAELNKRLDNIQDTIKEVNDRVRELDNRQRQEKR